MLSEKNFSLGLAYIITNYYRVSNPRGRIALNVKNNQVEQIVDKSEKILTKYKLIKPRAMHLLAKPV